MRRLWIATILAAFTLATTVAQADVLAEPKDPPAEKTLTGNLTWTYVKKSDGTEQKSWLKLQTADGRTVTLGPAQRLSAAPTVEVEKFIGKQVVVTVMAQETTGKQGTPVIRVQSIKDIKEVPPVKP